MASVFPATLLINCFLIGMNLKVTALLAHLILQYLTKLAKSVLTVHIIQILYSILRRILATNA